MKKIVFTVLLILLSVCVFATDFNDVDSLFDTGDFDKVYNNLQYMLVKSNDNNEKAQILWRLSRVCVILGDSLSSSDKKEKMALYSEGELYGQQAKEMDPYCVEAYLWHCANAGRWGETNGILASMSKVEPILNDVDSIINKLNCTNNSDAWYVLAAFYFRHPFKSTSEGIGYARVCIDNLASNSSGVNEYKTLADMLLQRNWTSDRRSAEFARSLKKWKSFSGDSNIDKHKYYEGFSANRKKPWLTNALSSYSDKEEAVLILKYAITKFDVSAFHTVSDKKVFSELQDLLGSLK